MGDFLELPLGAITNGFDSFLLIFVRMAGLFLVAPIFGRRNIPAYLKIGLSFMMALILVNTITLQKPVYDSNLLAFAGLIAKEAIVGIVLGYISYLVFTAIYMAGQLIDMQIGFGMVSVLDPVSNIQVPVTSNLYFIISMLIFLISNGHHDLIKALFRSYEIVPLGKAVFGKDLLGDILNISGNTLVIGFKIAAPVIAAMLIADIALGVLSRTVPQLNIFAVGITLKLFVGLLIMFLTIEMFNMVINILIGDSNNQTINFLNHMRPK